MAIEIVNRQDSRYSNLIRGHNSRWDLPAESAARIFYVETAQDAAEALQQIVGAGLRPTLRSSGHCYEDFIANNPGGAIIDLSLLNEVGHAPGGGYRVGAGAEIGAIYTGLYKVHNVTLPGASCTTVCTGGHITGGGYGVLSRLQGLTVDYVTAIDIATVDAKGKVDLRRVDRRHDPELFRALLGGGGGNFGVIANYYFEKLPPAPSEVMSAHVSFSWDEMTPERFTKILQVYGNYWETRGKDPDTWGLFTGLDLGHQSSGRLGVGGQFCNPDGTCKDTRVLDEFLNLFSSCNPVMAPGPPPPPRNQRGRQSGSAPTAGGLPPGTGADLVQQVCETCHGLGRIVTRRQDARAWSSTVKEMVARGAQLSDRQVAEVTDYLAQHFGPAAAAGAGAAPCGPPAARQSDWINAAVRGMGSLRAKYGSCYMKRNFTEAEAACYYKHLTRKMPGVDLSSSTVSVDSYGGFVNRPERLEDTAVAARGSIMKLQWINYWHDPTQDAGHIQWQRDFYKELYSGPDADPAHKGAPYWSERYEGCYINYPDRDMLQYPWWQQLFYGEKIVPFLQRVKRRYDPNNIFHHAMSIRT